MDKDEKIGSQTEFLAIYEGGMLRPLEELPLAEKARVQITFRVMNPDEADTELGRRQREAIFRLQQGLASTQEMSPADGLSGRDHDVIIYGKR